MNELRTYRAIWAVTTFAFIVIMGGIERYLPWDDEPWSNAKLARYGATGALAMTLFFLGKRVPGARLPERIGLAILGTMATLVAFLVFFIVLILFGVVKFHI